MRWVIPTFVAVMSLLGFAATAAATRTGPNATVTRWCILLVVSAAGAAVSAAMILRVRRTLAMPLPSVELDAEASRRIAALTDPPDLVLIGQGLALDTRDCLPVEVARRPRIPGRTPAGSHSAIDVTSHLRGDRQALHVATSEPARALAALLLEIRDRTGHVPHIRFSQLARRHVVQLPHWLLLGTADLATETRELLCRAAPDDRRRPTVQGG
ncbi:hypothetical protein ACFPIJ_51795 [Dactylosporangium cerinum]|uniref:Secreted protein n=1 Tax=Dactylosporangium cerinum TaxID=1434730 RepID=A0ABV9WFI6_9ACTN